MTIDTGADVRPPTPSRRTALGLGLGLGGGLAVAGLAPVLPAAAAPPALPLAPVLPATISDLAAGLDLVSSKHWHLARRVSPAPTQALVDQIEKTGYTRWIDKQLAWKKVSDTTSDRLVAKHLSWATMTTAKVERATDGESWKAGKVLSISRSWRQLFTTRHLYESMVETMSDQLYISADGKASSWVAWFDWAVLRKHALGRYSSMLAAATRHPAMLIYLDNHLNSADNPNENLGRELLELHSVGVGHYDEDDVRASARLLTGHGIDWDKLSYRFHPDEHDTGALRVMGFEAPEREPGDGPKALKAYLDYLAHHQGTAERIARRLAVRYVSDTPSEALVAQLARTYLDHDTSLAAVLRALLLSEEFLDSVGAKWRRPQEAMTAMVKVRKPKTIHPESTQQEDLWSITGNFQWLLYNGNHQPRMWPVVDGYPDQASDWLTTQALLTHWNNAYAMLFWSGMMDAFPRPSLAKALGVKAGQQASDVAARITRQLTGYTWPAAHLERVTALLIGGEGPKLTAPQISEYLRGAVHFVFTSPYFMLR
jgi:uncharacterized protein (DUF1800 family)